VCTAARCARRPHLCRHGLQGPKPCGAAVPVHHPRGWVGCVCHRLVPGQLCGHDEGALPPPLRSGRRWIVLPAPTRPTVQWCESYKEQVAHQIPCSDARTDELFKRADLLKRASAACRCTAAASLWRCWRACRTGHTSTSTRRAGCPARSKWQRLPSPWSLAETAGSRPCVLAGSVARSQAFQVISDSLQRCQEGR